MAPNAPPSRPSSPRPAGDPHPPTTATFAPVPSAAAALHRQLHRTTLVAPPSPLLVATPPPVTRALAGAYPFVAALDHALALLTWSAPSAWPSALLLAGFWLVALYGDLVVRWAGPALLLLALGAGVRAMQAASPAGGGGGSGRAAEGHVRKGSDGAGAGGASGGATVAVHTSLDEIVAALDRCTARAHLLLDPARRLVDRLGSPHAPGDDDDGDGGDESLAPALAALALRIFVLLPVWAALAHPAAGVITPRRITLVLGTLALTWHARPARALRALLWRSRSVRRLGSAVTGLDLHEIPAVPARTPSSIGASATKAAGAGGGSGGRRGVRFTFTVYQNQRRWLGLGWTSSLFAYERAAWTDEQLNPSPPKDQVRLPEVDAGKGGGAAWRWVEGSSWRVEPAPGAAGKARAEGWTFFDNKWQHGGAADGWGKYTRRRKWCRDAELVDVPAEPPADVPTPAPKPPSKDETEDEPKAVPAVVVSDGTADAPPSSAVVDSPEKAETASRTTAKRRGFFGRRESRASADTSSGKSNRSGRRDEDEEPATPSHRAENEGDFSYGDEMKMQLG